MATAVSVRYDFCNRIRSLLSIITPDDYFLCFSIFLHIILFLYISGANNWNISGISLKQLMSEKRAYCCSLVILSFFIRIDKKYTGSSLLLFYNCKSAEDEGAQRFIVY